MPRYASGRKALGVSDRSGFVYLLRNMKKEWNGSLVGPDEVEPKHPQLESPKDVADPQALRNPRPDITASNVDVPVGNTVFPPVDSVGPMIAAVGQVEVSIS